MGEAKCTLEDLGVREMQDDFYKGKRVLITGHTGFKGSWLSRMLLLLGADVTGYALKPPAGDSLFVLSGIEKAIRSVEGDVQDLEHLMSVFVEVKPEIVFHLAAQPLVLESYREPVHTYAVNVMGTAHVCECVRKAGSVISFLNVTTDKVYKNREWEWGYRENEVLCGEDPYSNSKSCSELVTESYRKSFFAELGIAASTARAGNVIGGGDFAADRLIPDCVRALCRKETVVIRNAESVRPFQHVLDPLSAYLEIAAAQYEDKSYEGNYNVGPDEKDCVTVGQLAELFCRSWGEGASWCAVRTPGPHEACRLKLDCSRMKVVFGWNPVWDIREAVSGTVEWTKLWREGGNMAVCMDRQIEEFWKKGRAR